MKEELIETLREIGLSEGEAKVYLSLLKLGNCAVKNIKEDTRLHRTNIYDFLDKLITKQLVSFYYENKIKVFRAKDPESILSYCEERKRKVLDNIKEFEKIRNLKKEEVKVEVHRGELSIKTLFDDIIYTAENYLAYGIDEEYWEKRFPELLIKSHFRKEKEINIKARLLTLDCAKKIYANGNYRFIPEENFYGIPHIIYGNKIANIIWEPFTLIIIENFDLVKAQKKTFELLWKNAQKTKPKEIQIID